MEFKKLENESTARYIWRMYKNKSEHGLTNRAVADIINNELDSNYQESYFRGIYKYYNIGFEEAITANDDDIMSEIEEKMIELKKETIKLQDQRRELNKQIRHNARYEHLIDTIKESVNNLNEVAPLIVNQNKENFNTGYRKEAVLILSDWHIGVVNDNAWNKFNLEIAKDRIDKLLNKTIQYCRLHEVNTIHVELLGDLVNGFIHIGNRIENEEDVISQTMRVSEMLSQFVGTLSESIPKVKVYRSTGNHGRCSANLKESIEVENFERIIPWFMQTRLSGQANIEFIENEIDDNIIVMEFLNETIYAVHGHLDKPNSVVNDLSKMLKNFPTEIHLGHYHSFKEHDDSDITVTVNGTLSGVDNFAKKIRKVGSPMQTLCIYNEEGRECTYKIKL